MAFFIQMPIYDITYHSNEPTNHSIGVVCCDTLVYSYKISIRSSTETLFTLVIDLRTKEIRLENCVISGCD